MKNIITRVIILAAAVAAFGLQAQAQSDQQYRAKVPFDFTAAGRSYTAGSYSVGKLSQNSEAGAVMLVDRQTGRSRVIGMTRGQASDNTGKLVFVKNGLHYALKEVITPSFSIKMKQPRQTIARAANDAEIIELALN